MLHGQVFVLNYSFQELHLFCISSSFISAVTPNIQNTHSVCPSQNSTASFQYWTRDLLHKMAATILWAAIVKCKNCHIHKTFRPKNVGEMLMFVSRTTFCLKCKKIFVNVIPLNTLLRHEWTSKIVITW